MPLSISIVNLAFLKRQLHSPPSALLEGEFRQNFLHLKNFLHMTDRAKFSLKDNQISLIYNSYPGC